MKDINDMMNCEQVQESIAAEPSRSDVASHVSQCAACREFQQEMQALDAKIEQALAIPVAPIKMPLLEPVETGNVSVLPRRRMTAPAWFAIAATAAFAAILGFRMLGSDIIEPSLADEIIAHLEHEPYAFSNTDTAVSDERLARIVPANVAVLDDSNGLITYAQSCVIHGNVIPHLVIQGRNGPVTILLMPNEKVDRAQNFTGLSINGVILPVGNGSIAIVGEDGEDLKRIEKSIKNSVTWST